MVHRDIKPGNIFLKYEYDDKYPGYSDKYPRVVLGDFDLAETIDDIRGMKPLNYRIGTPGSMAPEYYDAAGPGLITTKADVWSLAGVLWDLMNSKRGLADDPDYLPDHNSGLDFLRRGELHDAIIHGHPNFQDPEYPTHHFIQKELHTRYDLPQYTTWLANLVADCSTHHPSMRMGVITLVKEIKKHMDNVRLTTGGLGGPHDDLRFKEDPFLQNRIISLTRRRGG
ncbi:kinase-like protein [Karstenula rhodostoma CBS 690.94]|uniref:Kinase-like protein n=1 Tax=Karstenula rhodostoma CBS 690.94 TaxID=1392251 RepID=A0A9P4U727_9PLEO|nr:kinase-like protein [Karstenula rhodostoma CBS 690.94]